MAGEVLVMVLPSRGEPLGGPRRGFCSGRVSAGRFLGVRLRVLQLILRRRRTGERVLDRRPQGLGDGRVVSAQAVTGAALGVADGFDPWLQVRVFFQELLLTLGRRRYVIGERVRGLD